MRLFYTKKIQTLFLLLFILYTILPLCLGNHEVCNRPKGVIAQAETFTYPVLRTVFRITLLRSGLVPGGLAPWAHMG